MPTVDVAEESERAAVAATIDVWAGHELERGGSLVAAERQLGDHGATDCRWYLRFKGEEKEFITLWLALGQRTLHFETQFMPAPEENVGQVHAYLLRRNSDLYQMAF